MPSLSPWKEQSQSKPDRAPRSSGTWRRFCTALTVLLCTGPILALVSAQTASAFFGGGFGMRGFGGGYGLRGFGGGHGLRGAFPSLGSGYGRMYAPRARFRPGNESWHRQTSYPVWETPRHFSRRPPYAERDPEPYPRPQHRHRPVSVVVESQEAPPTPRPRHQIASLPAESTKTHVDKKIAAPPPPKPRALVSSGHPNSGISAAGDHRFDPMKS